MKLFKPKAPAAVTAGAAYQVHFAADYRNPDGSYKPPAPMPELPAALAKVAGELARLRTVIEAGRGVRSTVALQAEIARSRAELDAATKELARKRAQGCAAVINASEVAAAHQDFTRQHASLRALLDEAGQREKLDRAAAELARILETLQ